MRVQLWILVCVPAHHLQHNHHVGLGGRDGLEEVLLGTRQGERVAVEVLRLGRLIVAEELRG